MNEKEAKVKEEALQHKQHVLMKYVDLAVF